MHTMSRESDGRTLMGGYDLPIVQSGRSTYTYPQYCAAPHIRCKRIHLLLES